MKLMGYEEMREMEKRLTTLPAVAA